MAKYAQRHPKSILNHALIVSHLINVVPLNSFGGPPELIVHQFVKLAVDVIGLLVKSKSGFRFILTCEGQSTK